MSDDLRTSVAEIGRCDIVSGARTVAVSVIVPAFNAGRHLGETLESALTQSFGKSTELIVVDDGSTDDTFAVAKSFEPRVRILTKANGGQGSAREVGFRMARGEYVLFLDADDILEPSSIGELYEALHLAGTAPAAFCLASTFSDPGEAPTRPSEIVEDVVDAAWDKLVASNFIRTPGCVLIRSTVLADVGGWDTDRNLQGHEDWELWLRLAETGPFVRVPKRLLRYRVHSTNYSAKRTAMGRSCICALQKTARRNREHPLKGPLSTVALGRAREAISHDIMASAKSAVRDGRYSEAIRLASAAYGVWPLRMMGSLRRLTEVGARRK